MCMQCYTKYTRYKGVFLYENIDTNKMYVCIFKHTFWKWTVGEKKSLTGCSLNSHCQ